MIWPRQDDAAPRAMFSTSLRHENKSTNALSARRGCAFTIDATVTRVSLTHRITAAVARIAATVLAARHAALSSPAPLTASSSSSAGVSAAPHVAAA
jgi:hypothetical protein